MAISLLTLSPCLLTYLPSISAVLFFIIVLVQPDRDEADIFFSIPSTSGCSDESDSLSDGATLTGAGPVRVGLLLNQIPSSSRTGASSFSGPSEVQRGVVPWLVQLAHRRVSWARNNNVRN
ncbi:hypothetical protein BDP55DRAFT_646380 [Colletotrichum godetiae]|uniref:Uncharacterized protein n=1 Tax=Colletotrichum godetiae TaxID=1209918 RepID=A0AAJ0AYL0_9PEZI|nr:uncharacterized protein BDP55DRAFT_646380 [Colletotrichum godetiae]KAK1691235.1 hypothetical protein BDP55DRAFT_646380 [Colletotrichum godetiae]